MIELGQRKTGGETEGGQRQDRGHSGADGDQSLAGGVGSGNDGARHPGKSDGILCKGPEVKYAFIARHRRIWPISVQCRVLRVANAMPPDRKKPQRERPRLATAIPFIDAILESDRRAPRKQRHTAHRIWMRLRQEKPEIVIGESTVREYVNLRKQALGMLCHEIFVPQSYHFGGEAQVDW